MIRIEDWGLIDFQEAWDRQKVLADRVLKGEAENTIVVCQHPTVITLGRNSGVGAVLAKPQDLLKLGVDTVEINRGGEATVHNPGQLVGYPILNLQTLKPDLGWYLRSLENAIISTMAEFGLSCELSSGLTGVWLGNNKICAIGIHCSRWVTQHGLALNVENDLTPFNLIVPCGIVGKGITSMQTELEYTVDFEEVKCKVLINLVKFLDAQ